MANVRRIEFGSDEVSLFAEKGSFELVIGALGVVASAKTRREMIEKIGKLSDAMHDIRWELDRDYGVFEAFKDKEPAEEEAAAE